MCCVAGADHRALLQLEKEVDILMAQIKAEAPVGESKVLLHDIAVGTREALSSLACRPCRLLASAPVLRNAVPYASV